MSSVTSASAGIGASLRTACGSAPRSAEATIDGKLGSSAPRDLLGGLFDVPEVGDEPPHVDAHHRQPIGAREARQVAQVREVRDEQQIQLSLAQALGDAIDPAQANSSLSRSSASR
jgi:hypothetical protein